MSSPTSCYTTSASPPAGLAHLYSPIELPPLKNVPRQLHSQGASLFPLSIPQQRLPDISNLCTRPRPSIAYSPKEHYSPQSHLPTAPNSPVNLPALRLDGSRDDPSPSESRLKLTTLLN